jgi:NAD(P)H-quinone oxidoreductase subunit 5
MLGASSLALRTAPASRLSRWLYPHAFAGFHLDEGFTVLTQRLWPARLPRPVRDHHATVNFVKEA